jgi:bleomycin hydrolase
MILNFRKERPMKKIIPVALFLAILLLAQQLTAQTERHDTCIFVEDKDQFREYMQKAADEASQKEKEEKKELKMNFTGIDIPASVDEFHKAWYNEPVIQGLTGTCWAFSSTSFFESEIYRLTQRKIKLSEMYTVYWEYVEKAQRFVHERGDSLFSKGSQPNATKRVWKKYGVVPKQFYTGMSSAQEFLDLRQMYSEMKAYLESVKETNAWNEDVVLATIKSILNHYMGAPPSMIAIDGKQMTPREYFESIIKLNLDDYADVMSLMEKPYYEKVEYEVEDNWWHSKEYYNVPLDDFIKIIKKAVREGYTVSIAGDTSEAGLYDRLNVAMVPTFDIPSDYIDEYARQFRFSNESTTDVHAIHLVGYLEKDGKDWYLIKDSGTGAQNGKIKGYFFYHEDYVKLKMLNYMVHKDIVKEIVGERIH